MDDNGEHITPVAAPIKNAENRDLAAAIVNLVFVYKHNAEVLEELYTELCEMAGAAPKPWRWKLVASQEESLQQIGLHVAGLRAVVS